MWLKFVKINYFLFQVHVPCRRGVHQEFCRRYDYPPVDRSYAAKHKPPPSPSWWRFPTGMGKEALLPGSIEPGKFYDFIGDKEAFNDLGLKEGEVNRKIDRSLKCCLICSLLNYSKKVLSRLLSRLSNLLPGSQSCIGRFRIVLDRLVNLPNSFVMIIDMRMEDDDHHHYHHY